MTTKQHSQSKGMTGKHHSEKTKKLISLHSSHHPAWNKNKKLPDISILMQGNKHNLGKTRSEHTKQIMREKNIGDKNPNWKNGATSKNKLLRCGTEWKNWRDEVFKYDNHTCWICEKVGGKLHPHHLLKFSDYPELRFAKNNGITLCEFCHRTYTDWGNHK